MIELWVFDMQFNRLAIIDEYEEIEAITYYQAHSELKVKLPGTKRNADLFLTDADRIIVKSNDIHRGYYVETPQYYDESSVEMELLCRSLTVMMSWRYVTDQQRYIGSVEDVIKSFINHNAINPSNINRKIPDLVLGLNEGINLNVDETYAERRLDEVVWELCKKYDLGFEILMNYDAKKYVASTFVGLDRSTEQSANPRVIFAKAFDNVTLQSYADDKSNERTTAYVFSEEGTIVVNDNKIGFDRREHFFDPGIDRTYKDENDNEITMTESEFQAALTEAGNSELAEYPRVRSFESEVDPNTQFVYGRDYGIGDKVTNRNDELGIVTHSRVVTAKEKWNRKGYSLSLEFGTSIPTLLDKLRRVVK